MSRRIVCKLAMALLALSATAWPAAAGEAEKPLGVVELFTSQGCNSCPPADELFSELARRSDLVALAYHVDYWDYLGWRDTLSSPENTARQYDYMRAFQIRSVYTPQAVVNGATHVNGANRPAVMRALDSTPPPSVAIAVARADDSIVVEAGSSSVAIGEAHLLLVYFDPPQEVEIVRGENKGRTLTYWNAVTGLQTVGMWHGKTTRYEFPAREIAKKSGSVVLLQMVGEDGMPGAILGAAMVRKPQDR